jgi:hypothetical protein
MKTLARITTIMLVIFGILAMLGGMIMGVVGVVRAGVHALSAAPIVPGARLVGGGLGGLVVLILVFIQGLMCLAAGEGLYMLANMAGK